MSNYFLSTDKQIAVTANLADGSSIRGIERMTGIHRETIMRWGVRIGQGCARLMDERLRNLEIEWVELDEIWGFIGKKMRHVQESDDPTYGDVWTYCAIDAESKLIPSYHVSSKRDIENTTIFIADLASRINNRLQISSDAMTSYPEAIEAVFGQDVDYAQIVKTYQSEDGKYNPERKYSQPRIQSSERILVQGRPEAKYVSTSYVERMNATTRLHVKRLNRLTLAFSKKFENFQAAVSLHFAAHNFVRTHSAQKMTPAVAADVEHKFWSYGDLVEAPL